MLHDQHVSTRTLPQLQVLENNRWEIPPPPNRTSANNLLCHWCYLWISHHQMTNLGNYASCKTDTYSHVIAMYRNDQNLAYSSSFKVRVFNVTFVLQFITYQFFMIINVCQSFTDTLHVFSNISANLLGCRTSCIPFSCLKNSSYTLPQKYQLFVTNFICWKMQEECF